MAQRYLWGWLQLEKSCLKPSISEKGSAKSHCWKHHNEAKSQRFNMEHCAENKSGNIL